MPAGRTEFRDGAELFVGGSPAELQQPECGLDVAAGHFQGTQVFGTDREAVAEFRGVTRTGVMRCRAVDGQCANTGSGCEGGDVTDRRDDLC